MHVLGDGFVVVEYRPSLSEDERSSLAEWAVQSRGVVVTPALDEITSAVSAQTRSVNFSCQRLSIEALNGFLSRWFTGASGS